MKEALFTQVLYPVLGSLVTMFLGWALYKFNCWTGIQVEAKHREALHSAIMTGIGLAIARAGIELPKTIDGATVPLPSSTQRKVVAEAMNYVNSSVPDAIKNFNLDKKPDILADMIVGKAGSILGNLLQSAMK